MLTLVTVVCERDFEVFELQLESIVKFVDKCTHWIIINELDHLNFDKWQNLVKRYYTSQHIGKILTLDSFMPLRAGGYKRQQALKILISENIQGDYLILDSKNFFIRPSNLGHWKDTLGCGAIREFAAQIDTFPSHECNLKYSKFFQTMPLDKYLLPHTPFFVQKKYLDQIKDFQAGINCLIKEDRPCEFLFYSYLIPHYVLNTVKTSNNIQYKTFWSNFWTTQNLHLLKELMTIYTINNKVLILGFHFEFLALIKDNKSIEDINKFLNYIGLKYSFSMSNTMKMRKWCINYRQNWSNISVAKHI